MEIKVSSLKVKQKVKVEDAERLPGNNETSPTQKPHERLTQQINISNSSEYAVIDESIRDLTYLSTHDVDIEIKNQQIVAIIDKLSDKMMTKLEENEQMLKRISDIDCLIDEELSKFRKGCET